MTEMPEEPEQENDGYKLIGSVSCQGSTKKGILATLNACWMMGGVSQDL